MRSIPTTIFQYIKVCCGPLLLTFTLLAGGCSATKSLASLNDKNYFKESPGIVVKDNRYFLRFVYADGAGALKFFMMTWSKIRDNTLIFYLPATSSSGNLEGRTQFEEITTTEKIELIKNNKVYWREPGGALTPLVIEPMKNGEGAMIDHYAQVRKH